MAVKLGMSIRNERCFAGDVVEGTVDLDVTAESAEGCIPSELVLKLVGKAGARSVLILKASGCSGEAGTPAAHVDKEEKYILSHDVQLASFSKEKVVAGRRSFLFSILLPSSLPPSVQISGVSGGGCVIVYGFEARLHCPGLPKFEAKSKAKFRVLASPEEIPPATPATVGPELQNIWSCCSNSGGMYVGFGVDRSVVGRNDLICVTVVVRNDSSSTAKAVHVKILEEIAWYAEGNKDDTSRTIASTTAASSDSAQLGEMLQKAGTVDRRGRRSHDRAAAGDLSQRHLQETLRAGAGVKIEISVPDTCCTTMQTGIVEIRHLLIVEVETNACESDPELWMPLRVVQKKKEDKVEEEREIGGQVMDQPSAAAAKEEEEEEAVSCFVPSSSAEETLSDAAATKKTGVRANTGGGGGGGYPTPVSVPESAVKIEYSTAMPKSSAPGTVY